jgi:L-alanine-DL-glutamate epimerase-like enolase superfamily enzyme
LIREISVVSGAIPLTKTRPEQQWVDEWSTQLFVKVVADDGQEGWGEVLPSAANYREPYASLVRRIGEALVGQEESDIRGLWKSMRMSTFSGGYGITTGAISGIDVALWDIFGKRAGKPLSRVLGAKGRKAPRYVSLSRYRKLGDLSKVVGSLLKAGYSSVKLHQAASDSLEAVRRVRADHGNGFDLMCDLNCAFEFAKAFEFMKKVGRYELKWVEEPVWPPDDFDSLSKLNKEGPVAAGENFFSCLEFRRLMEMEALSIYQPDVSKVGGVTPALEILKLAKAHKAKIAFHCRPHNGWIGTMASAHIASALDPEALIESPPNEVPTRYFWFKGEIDEKMITPGGPGLGIAPKTSIPTSKESKLLAFH